MTNLLNSSTNTP